MRCLLMLELLSVSAALESYGRQMVFSLAVVVSLQPSKEKKIHLTLFIFSHFFVNVLSQVKRCFNKGSAEQSPSV